MRTSPARGRDTAGGGRETRGTPPSATPASGETGTLYVVATPIGNLADISARAIEVLRACPIVAAEDTRRLRLLADRFGFRPRRVVRCDEHTEERATRDLLNVLLAGEDVALTGDAGTPAIADPGFRVVREARARGVRVVPVPGACAPVAALSASGLPSDRFLFAGFPPRKSAERGRFLDELLERPETLLLLESPGRVLALLADVGERVPERRVVVARELTKVHEELIEGSASEIRERLGADPERLRGEFVVLVAGSRPALPDGSHPEDRPEARRMARELLARPWAEKLSRRDLADLIALACGLERNAAYRMAQEPRT